MVQEVKRSVCPYDCPDACSLLITTENDRVIKVMGDPNHRFTRGTLCPKMVHYEKTVYSPLRLAEPLLRTGPKGSGQFRPISWEEAIQRIIAKWHELTRDYGAESILPCSYAGTMGVVQNKAGHPFFHRLGASQLHRTLCTPAKDYGWRAVMGATLPPHPDEVIESDLILLWGTNTLATNIHFLHGVREAQKRGATVWLIETYQTPTADLADRAFLVRPGSDGALALGIMHILVRDGLIDQGFLHDHVQGFEEFEAHILPNYTPWHVSDITGLDVALLEELALAYGKAKAPFIRLGSGLSRYGNGAMTVRTITCLPALVGAWRKPGGGLMPDLSTGGALASDEISRPDLMKKPTRVVNLAQLGYALTELTSPPIKSLYVYNCNPAAVLPDQNRVLAGLAREDLFTVVHERFMTDTARYADIVLPATTSLEHADIYRAYGHYCLQRAFAVIPPVGQAKSNWEVFGSLAQAMGFTEDIFRRTADEMIEHMLSFKTPWLAQVDLNELLTGNPVELPLPADYKTTYQTPSGKIEIWNPQEDDALPRYTPPHNEEGLFWLMTAPAVLTLNSSFNERPELLEKKAAMTLQMNPEDAAHKQLVDGQHVVAFNPRGNVTFILCVTPRVPRGIVVAEGVWWIKDAPGDRTVNALTSQRVTDRAAAATYYDTKVDVRPLGIKNC